MLTLKTLVRQPKARVRLASISCKIHLLGLMILKIDVFPTTNPDGVQNDMGSKKKSNHLEPTQLDPSHQN